MLWDPFDPSWSISRCCGTHPIPVGASADALGPVGASADALGPVGASVDALGPI